MADIIAVINGSIGLVEVSHKGIIYFVKLLSGTGSGYVSYLIWGIERSTTNGMNMINFSLGTVDSQSLHEDIIKAYQSGIVIIDSAGYNQKFTS